MAIELKFKATLSDVSATERQAFADRHRLSDDEARRFFATFHQPIPLQSFGAPPSLSRKKRRVATLQKIRQDLRRATLATRRAAEAMQDLMDATPSRGWAGRNQEHPLVPLLPEVEEIGAALDKLAAEIKQHSAQEFYPEPWDRRMPSQDREHVVNGLLTFWARCGRPLTYTRDDVSKTRTGPLIEFLQDALMLLSDPPASLGAENLARMIKDKRFLVSVLLHMEAKNAERTAAERDPFT